jgi:uncharacterized repeat protein (TIGR03806 family)
MAFLLGATVPGPLRAGGLDRAEPIGPFLDGVLPALPPTPATGSWELVEAFPNLVFVDPVQMIPVPGAAQLMVAEKWGALMVFPDDEDAAERSVVLDLSGRVQVKGDSGLLGVAFHPEFGQTDSPNREYLYVYYRYTPDPEQMDRAYCRLSRFSWQGGLASIDPGSEQVLINQYDRHNWHNGGGLFFGNDGFLYLSIGDEGGTNDAFGSAQRRDRGLFSGVFRIDVDQDPSRSHPIRRQPVDAEMPPPGWPSSFTQGYSIPDDNPWLSPDGTELEEYWAIGARSPYRMTIDRPTGRIWTGDVGQSAEEEINVVSRGDNLQWPFREGTRAGPRAKPAALLGTERPPVFRYGRGEGGCVIGGYVYRGSDHPELAGKYVFGDFNNGQIRTLDDSGGTPVVETIAELGDQQLTGFGIDSRNELYLLTIGQTGLNGGIVHKLRRNGNARPQPPATLSATGAFSDLASLTPRTGVMPYDLVQSLWSDGAEKRRWIAIPNDGTPDTEAEQIGFSENGPWEFPVGTVLIKHFEYGGRRLETRFLVKGENGAFFGFTYRWRPDHSDADLLPAPALDETIPVGGGRSLAWHFPARSECFECHTDPAGVVLGPKTRHLNRELLYPATGRTANQIETLNDLGFFRNPPEPAAIPGFLTAANLDDTKASLERRARSYLDINCAHCHVPGGPTRTAFDLRLTTPPHGQNLIDVAPGDGLGFPDPRLVKSGAPEASVIPFRMGSLDECCSMPPIAKNAIDEKAVRVVTEWIASLDPGVNPAAPAGSGSPADHSPPRLSLSLPGGSDLQARFLVQVTASEPVFGLTAGDFVVTNGRILSLEGSGTDYTLAIQPRLPGIGTVTLPSDRCTDESGNANPPLAAPVAFTVSGTAFTNLLENGGFENGLAGWVRHDAVSTAPPALNGASAARLTGASFLQQTVPVTPLTHYRFTAWSRSEGTASPNPARGVVAFWDGEGRWIKERTLVLPSGSSWDSFIARFTAPEGAASATVTILGTTGGDRFVDDLSFGPGGEGDPPVGALTENGDFERGLLFWETLNDVTVSGISHLGSGAARIGAGSSITFRRPLFPGTRVVMTGTRYTEGNPVAAAGLSFWNADGERLLDASIPLASTPVYVDFHFFANVPEGTAEVTMWIRNGPEGVVTVDDLGLIHVFEGPVPDPAGPDTGFEDGLPPSWTGNGTVTLTDEALSGTRSARLDGRAFLETSHAAGPEETWRFSGLSRVSGPWTIREGGLVFRDRNGRILAETTKILPAGESDSAFTIAAKAPASTVAVSAWVRQGQGGPGGLTLDDLTLRRLPGSVPPPSAAGVHASAHVLIAGRLTRDLVAALEPDRFSDRAANRVQPDLNIAGAKGGRFGEGIFNATGAGQTLWVRVPRRFTSLRFETGLKNAALALRDGAVLAGSPGNRAITLSWFENDPAGSNRSAEIIAGTYETPAVLPGAGRSLHAQLRRTKAYRGSRFLFRLRARSSADTSAVDEVRGGLR